ncbi:transcription initiation factor iie alpha subunit [Holotrichia oblita]|uniref:Transcription initiation factor iie alpha subunit n=1 Tax=Holotrichia oblita TaxID=644536 RepID=A0ACB9TES9_HOLOL|nr:transcription initiation factor iie alpha subunit [Holotrichia oblita]
MTEERLVTEVPSSLKQLARLVVRGFYTIEDALIIDMLVRNPCMKEDDIYLEADQLFDFLTSEFRCTYCREVVEEDQSALPKKDSRLLLAKFNEQLEPLYILLREVEGIKLAPEVLEPEPVDINTIRGIDKKMINAEQAWSGEASRNTGFLVEETRVDVTIGDDNVNNAAVNRKEQPIWMMESTVLTNNDTQSDSKAAESILEVAAESSATGKTDDIMSVLLAHEKRATNNAAVKGLPNDTDSSSDEMTEVKENEVEEVETMDSEDDDDSNIPTVIVGNRTYNITDINDTIIAEMTQAEKEVYVQVFQDYYSHMSY